MSGRTARWRGRGAALEAGPWCWPGPETIAFETAAAAFGLPPPPKPGHVAAITVRGQTTTVWHLQPFRPGLATTPLGSDAHASWRNAGIALPRSLPVLWRSVHDATREPPGVRRLRATLSAAGFEEREPFVDGPSFGLAFFLVLASSVLDCPVPGDVIASAGIDAFGRLSPVDALARKIDGIVELAPSVCRIMVAADQARQATDLARGRLEVVGAQHAAEALDRIFGERLSTLLVEAGSDPGRRAELTSSFFRLALVGRGAAIDWSPVARGAGQALDTWTDLGAEPRYQLQFARAVAGRHESNEGSMPLPDPVWLAAQPRMLRVQVLSHLVQQAADTASPDAATIEALAREAVEPVIEEAFVPELRLHGALCRLQALTGRADEALHGQERLARVLAAVFAIQDVSFPLSEWLRLAGALGDRASLDRASEFRQQMLSHGGFGEHGTPYVDLAWARGRLQLDPGDADAWGVAVRLCDDPTVPAHVRWSAHRWAGEPYTRALRTATDARGMDRRYDLLASLDAAVRAGEGPASDALVEALQHLDPGPVGHLRRHGADAGEVARLYPY